MADYVALPASDEDATLVIARAVTPGEVDNKLHIGSIPSTPEWLPTTKRWTDSRTAICGVTVYECATVNRDDLFCGQCWDAYAAKAAGLDMYRLGELTAIRDDAFDELGVTPHDVSAYHEYLKSAHWQHMREIAHEHYGGACCLCGSTDGIDVHHRTYERKGKERLSDVTLLCRDCHRKFHGRAA